jgi:DNA repair exonuclease SbcCD ATPase subunit
LRFSWARELADKATACDECGYVYATKRGDECPTCKAPRGKKLAQELELLCDDGSGLEEDARFNSGGTRAIVGAAVRLAASAMLRRMRGSSAAWAIVDEPFGSLDAENREQLARTFAGMLNSVGLEQAFVVSHDPVLLEALPHRIVIDRDGSSSTPRFE